ncbi:MAG: DUF5672 family protein [Alistipes indistinctus]
MVVAGAVFRCVGRLSDYVCDSRRSLGMTPVMMRFPSCRIESFDPSFFAGRYGYNHLMLSAEFYRRFLNWEYILILPDGCFCLPGRTGAVVCPGI